MNTYIKIFRTLFFVFLVSALMSGCSLFTKYGKLTNSAEKAYQSGNYDLAVRDSSSALKIKPDYEEAQVILVNSFPISIRNHEERAKELGSKTDLDSVGPRVDEYRTLIGLNNMVRNLSALIDEKTGMRIEFQLTDYSEQFVAAKQDAAEAYYNNGHSLGGKGGLDNSKLAAKSFKKSQSFVAGYKDSATLYEKYRQAAIKRIAILSFENKSGNSNHGAIGDLVSDQIISKIMGTPSAIEFLKIISRSELEQAMLDQNVNSSGSMKKTDVIKVGKALGLHEIIIGQITQVNLSKPQTTVQTIKEKANVVVGKEKYINDEGKERKRNVYRDVRANVKVSRMYANAKIAGSYKIIDTKTGRLIKTDSMTGEHIYDHKWGSASGDERAISRKLLGIISNEPGISPSAGDRVNSAAGDLVRSLANKIIAYTE